MGDGEPYGSDRAEDHAPHVAGLGWVGLGVKAGRPWVGLSVHNAV